MAYNSVGYPIFYTATYQGSPPCHLLVSSSERRLLRGARLVQQRAVHQVGPARCILGCPAALGALPLMLLMMLHRPRLHQPRRLDCCIQLICSFDQAHVGIPVHGAPSPHPGAQVLHAATHFNDLLQRHPPGGPVPAAGGPPCCLQPQAFELVCMRSSSAVAGDCSTMQNIPDPSKP